MHYTLIDLNEYSLSYPTSVRLKNYLVCAALMMSRARRLAGPPTSPEDYARSQADTDSELIELNDSESTKSDIAVNTAAAPPHQCRWIVFCVVIVVKQTSERRNFSH